MDNLNLDQLYKKLIENFNDEKECEKYKILFEKKILNEKPFNSKNYQTLDIITSNYPDKKIRILDYGCGGGRLTFYLYSLGYRNIKGCDVLDNYGKEKSNQIDKNNSLFSKILNEDNIFSSCKQFSENGENLTIYKDKSFDLILSEYVLEHCHNLEGYTDECARLLDNNGSAYLTFGQRLKPVENHINTMFIHWFPKFILNFWLDVFRKEQGGSRYYKKLLNLKSVFYFIKLFNSKFKKVDWLTPRYLTDVNIKFYKRRKKMRLFFNYLFKLKIIGNIIRFIVSYFSNPKFIIYK